MFFAFPMTFGSICICFWLSQLGWRSCWYPEGGGGWEKLLNTQECMWAVPTTKHCLVENVGSVKAKILWSKDKINVNKMLEKIHLHALVFEPQALWMSNIYLLCTFSKVNKCRPYVREKINRNIHFNNWSIFSWKIIYIINDSNITARICACQGFPCFDLQIHCKMHLRTYLAVICNLMIVERYEMGKSYLPLGEKKNKKLHRLAQWGQSNEK